MPLQKTTVPIPMGGGEDRFADERLLAPPGARRLDNVRVPTQGAITKTDGFATYGSTVQLGDGVVVAPTEAGVVAVGSKAIALWEGNPPAPVPDATGVPVPTRVRRRPVVYFKGWLTQPNIAEAQGFTCVVVNERFKNMPGGASTEITHVLVLDADWNVLSHQRTVPYYEARVEAYVDAVNNDLGFVLIGTDAVGGGGTSKLNVDSVWKSSSWALLGQHALVTDVWNTEADATRHNRFDSHAAGTAATYITYLKDTGARATTDWVCLKLAFNHSTGAVTVTTKTIQTGVTPDAHTVWYDGAQDTVLAYLHSNGTTLDVAPGSLSAFSTVTMPSTPGYDTWQGNADVLGNRGKYPHPSMCFWQDADGKIRLPGIKLTSGASHVVTAAADAAGYWVTMHRRPQPMNTTGRFVTIAQRDESRANLPTHYKRPPSMGDMDVRVPYATAVEMFATGISSSQRANFYDGNGAAYRCGQSAVSSQTGRLLVPYTQPEPNATPQKPGVAATTSPWSYGEVESPPEFPFGDDNGSELLAVAEVDFASGERSYVRLGDTTLIAAGALLATDGDQVFPAWLDRPACLLANPQPDTHALQDSFTALTGPQALAAGAMWLGATEDPATGYRGIAVVLVFTDKNGNQIRSEPFYTVDHRSCDNPARVGGSPAPVPNGEWGWAVYGGHALRYAAWFELFLPPSLIAAGVTAYNLKAQVYLTTAYNPASEPPKEDWYLACVSEVVQSGSPARYYFVVRDDLGDYDPGTLFKPAQSDNPGLRPAVQESLYAITDAPATRPPATNVIATAGQYAFLVPSEYPRVVWVSKPLEQGRLPEWSALLTTNSPAGGGDIVSIAGTGDRLFLLCEHGTWELFVGGGGPDATGAGAFPAPRRIYTRDSCLGHGTTTSGMWGVFYLTASGPKLITPDGEQDDIGKFILADMNVSDMATAVYREDTREVWLFGRTTGAWVYNLLTRAWSHVGFSADQSAEFGSQIMRFTASTGALSVPASGPFDEANNPVLETYVSPWLTLGDPLSYKRLWRVFVNVRKLEGTFGGLTIKLAYDYIDTDVDSRTFLLGAMAGLHNPNVLVVRPSQQKCAAVRVTITGALESDGVKLTNDCRWAFSGLELEVGTKQTGIKLAPGNKQ